MPTMNHSGITSPRVEDDHSIQSSRQSSKAVKVYIRLMFVRIGEIDTLNEKYQAQASIEARWVVTFEKLSLCLSVDDQQLLLDGKSVSLPKYADTHWHPQLYIENALGDLKEQIRYSARRSKNDDEIYVCEHRDIKGVFWEKLELQHFPSDVQDLSISVASMLYDDKVVLTVDPNVLSGVNHEAFVDQQEWSLYKHVDSEQRYAKEFLLREDEDEEDDEDDQNNNGDRNRPILTVTCHAARHSNYFYWNGYCLIFLITLASFCIFGIPPNLGANRVQISCTLLLTSITFRWTVNRSLPTISYLTSMDIYAIICIFILVGQCIWHGVICVVIFLNTPDFRITPSMWFVKCDQAVFFAVIGLFIVMHVALLIWFYLVPYGHRKRMAAKDLAYKLLTIKTKRSRKNKTPAKLSKKPSSFCHIPMEKEVEIKEIIL